MKKILCNLGDPNKKEKEIVELRMSHEKPSKGPDSCSRGMTTQVRLDSKLHN